MAKFCLVLFSFFLILGCQDKEKTKSFTYRIGIVGNPTDVVGQ
jgi:uncharacterized lipoprotein YehR (DUF1307 family)